MTAGDDTQQDRPPPPVAVDSRHFAIDRALERTDLALRTISVDVIRSHGGGITGLQHWQKGRAEALAQLAVMLDELIDTGLTTAKLSVAASLMDDLTRAAG
jgi:NAD-specific glutamate dehydrogenase